MIIREAVIQVMREKGAPMSIGEVYAAIMAAGLYSFKAQDPERIVGGAIRRHCVDIHFPSAYDVKYFQSVDGGRKYVVLPKPVKVRAQAVAKKRGAKKSAKSDAGDLGVSHLKHARDAHKQAFKADMLRVLKSMSPQDFEHFARKLLVRFGFQKVEVTSFSRDGGIDGYGDLHVGMSVFPVAFQCKRYGSGSVGAKEVREFRGAVARDGYVYGVFFTTARFASGCHDDAYKTRGVAGGVAPVILYDGDGIVDLMIEKRFGVRVEESLPVYANDLDLLNLASDE